MLVCVCVQNVVNVVSASVRALLRQEGASVLSWNM